LDATALEDTIGDSRGGFRGLRLDTAVGFEVEAAFGSFLAMTITWE